MAASINKPKTISRLPAILRSTSKWALMANPANPAAAPRAVKTMEKPITKLREWKNMGKRFLLTVGSNISGPHRLARYTGTRGSTQGEKNDTNPALKAITIDAFSVTIIHSIMYPPKVSSIH